MNKQGVDLMECSRVFALPTTIFCWLVVFVYSLLDSGNVLYGLLAFVGLVFAHFGTNVIDDYFDYKSLIKQVGFDKSEYLKNSQKTKCRYLVSGVMKETDLLMLAGVYFLLAVIVGLFLFIKCGTPVLYFAFYGGVIALLYPFVSRICLSEVFVALAYGPALFGGVSYVMTGTYSKDVFLVSIPTMIMTVILLYIHTVMDYEYDCGEGKCTIANRFNSRLDALIVLKIFLIIAYIAPILLCILDILDWQIFLTYLTIPLAVDLYKSLEDFACNPENVPERKWYHKPMSELKRLKEDGEIAFMFRICQARNLMMYYSIFFVIGILLSLGL